MVCFGCVVEHCMHTQYNIKGNFIHLSFILIIIPLFFFPKLICEVLPKANTVNGNSHDQGTDTVNRYLYSFRKHASKTLSLLILPFKTNASSFLELMLWYVGNTWWHSSRQFLILFNIASIKCAYSSECMLIFISQVSFYWCNRSSLLGWSKLMN